MFNQQALSRINGREAFVMADTMDSFVSNLSQFARTNPDQAAGIEAAARESLEFCYSIDAPAAERKPFIYNDGVAIIPIHGSLLNRFGGSWGFITGYQFIRRQMNAALDDPDVKLIVFDVDSPGGETAGCFELAEEIRASRAVKPSLAVVDSLSASAGYALASAATSMVATPSSKIGSVGVYIMHVDISGALDQAGISINYIEAPKGGMKTAGTPYRKMDRREQQYFQDFVDASYEDFVAMVVANRGMEDAAVRETEARIFRSEEALALRLIDAVKTPSDAVSSFVAELAAECEDDDLPQNEDDEEMSKTPSEVSSAAPAAAAPAAAAAPDAATIQAAIEADRERMSTIKALPEAASRPKLADTLALGGYTVDQAKSLLSAAAEESSAAPAPAAAAAAPAAPAAPAVDQQNHFAAAMEGSKHPEVGAGAPAAAAPGGEPTAEDQAAAILKDQGSVIGRNFADAK